ncbi:MAG TPA: alpha/beta fold hydrolase [Candidatus Acidoferrales bacterium]|nr:alpha/beta fold hydrolase [Candidatus Acidoferrales bacterium]
MRSLIVLLLAALFVSAFAESARAQQPVSFVSADGLKIHAVYYPAPGASAPIVLLLHQAGSNHWEYALVAPRLVHAGFSCLALDQRAGGDMWGHKNETAAQLARSADYLDALGDLEAALAWARKQDPSRKVIFWGSSYSASLVFLLAAKHPGEIAGLLSFSPGEYFEDKHLVRDAAAKVNIPVFVDSAKSDDEEEKARAIFDFVPDTKDKVQFLPQIAGVHGSSTLRDDRNPLGAAENWKAVLDFLQQFRQ